MTELARTNGARVVDIEREAIQAESRPRLITKLGASAIFAPLPPVPWLVEGLDFCPGPPHLVAGFGFSGKTVAMQALAIAVVAGRRAWGTFTVRQGRALHLDFEQGRRLTFDRYQRLAWAELLTPDELEGLDVAALPGLYLDDRRAETVLVEECAGYALVVVDSLRAAAPTLDENSSDARRVLDMLHRVSVATGATIVVVHHARKPTKDAPGGARMTIRGSGALFDACASVLVFDGPNGEPVRVTHQKARTSGRLASDFLLRIEDVSLDGDRRGGLAVVAEAAPVRRGPVTDDELEARLLATLGANPDCSRRWLVDHTEGKSSALFSAVKRLVVSGRVVEGDNGLTIGSQAREAVAGEAR